MANPTWPIPDKLKLRIFKKVSLEGKGRASCVCNDFNRVLSPIMKSTIKERNSPRNLEHFRGIIQTERNCAALVSGRMKEGEILRKALKRLIDDDDVDVREYQNFAEAVYELIQNRGTIVYGWTREKIAALDCQLYDGPIFKPITRKQTSAMGLSE